MATVGSDEIINIKCCFCLEENRIREADKYCVDCKDYYCNPCINTHKKFPATKGHKLLDKSDFKSLSADGSLPMFPTQRCSQHQAEVINMFCGNHNVVACASCMFFAHRTCTDIHSIPEEIDNLYNRSELDNTKQKIDKAKNTLKEIRTAKEKQIKDLKEAFDTEVKSVKTFKEELQTLLNAMEKETIRELKKEYERIELVINTEVDKIKDLINGMDELSSQIKKSEGNKSQEFISIKSSEKVTTQAEDMEKELNRKTGESISFSPEKNIKNFLQKYQALGAISSPELTFPITKDSLYNIKQRKQINVKLSSDSNTHRILGSCITEDGFLLLTDANNKKLKRVHMSNETVKDYLEFQDGPIAVCQVKKAKAAVTLANNSVQFVSLGNKLTSGRTLTMKHYCYGLAYKDGKLFISDCGKNVYMYDMNGMGLLKISTDSSGNDIFVSSRHITISASGDKVFVTDVSKGLVVLDIMGNYQSTLTDPSLLNMLGVCTDGRNLFVSGHTSNNIVQVGHDYKLLGELGKLETYFSLCFDHHNTRLIATAYNSNNITVFDLV